MVQSNTQKTLLSYTFALLVISALSACGRSVKPKNSNYHDATVVEKGLNDAGCKFVSKVGADGKTTETLECEDKQKPEDTAKQEKALTEYAASVDKALKTPRLHPVTMAKLTARKANVMVFLTKLTVKKVTSANAANKTLFTAAQTTAASYKALLAGPNFGCTFDAKNKIVCTKSLDDVQGEGTEIFSAFQSNLSNLSNRLGDVLKLDKNYLTPDERKNIEEQIKSVDQLASDAFIADVG